jgi:hypothetical protein
MCTVYASFWASDHVELMVRHHRLETYDKVGPCWLAHLHLVISVP